MQRVLNTHAYYPLAAQYKLVLSFKLVIAINQIKAVKYQSFVQTTVTIKCNLKLLMDYTEIWAFFQ